MEDTRTPFILTVVFNVLMLAIMVPAFYATTDSAKVVALAASYSIAYWVILVIATWLLSRRLGGLEVGQTVATIGKLLIAGIAAAAVTFAVVSISTHFIPEAGRWGLLVDLLIGSVFGALAFALAALALRIAEVRDAINLVRRRLGGATA
jgi:putative peptidoglycan lipid II flippase